MSKSASKTSKFSIMPKSIKQKLILAFVLMSIIPLMLIMLLAGKYIYNLDIAEFNTHTIIVITAIIAILGWVVARTLVYPVITMARKVKLFIDGNEFEGIEVDRDDEIGDLSYSINKMAARLNSNVDTLKSYEKRISSINMEINKKVTALSTLFQISNIMSTAKDLNVILQTVIERLPDVVECDKSFLVIYDRHADQVRIKVTHNLKPEEIEELENDFSKGVLARLAEQRTALICDADHAPSAIGKNIQKRLQLENVLAFPVVLHGEVECTIILGNNSSGFGFKEDDIELMRVFSKQISIAIENSWLTQKTHELSVKDELTGLFNTKFIKSRLKEEIQRAIQYQRPCSFTMLTIDQFEEYQDKFGADSSNDLLKKMADVLKANIDKVDKVARYSNHTFAIILPEKNKREAQTEVDRIREKVKNLEFPQQDKLPGKNITVSVAVTANPIDGTNADELIAKTQKLLETAAEKGGDAIVV